MNEFLLIAGMAIVTYAIRYPAMALLGRFTPPQAFFGALKFVPPVVLTAITAPALLMPQGQIKLGLDNTRLLAGLLAILVAWRTKNLLLTIVTGMAGLWVLQFLPTQVGISLP